MKKIFFILSPLFSLIIIIVGHTIYTGIATQGSTPTELYYRPMVMYNDEYYLIITSGLSLDLSEEELESVGVLASDVSIHNLPTENMQSCGVEYLIGQNIYVTEKYPEYLFVYKTDGTLLPFVLESAR